MNKDEANILISKFGGIKRAKRILKKSYASWGNRVSVFWNDKPFQCEIIELEQAIDIFEGKKMIIEKRKSYGWTNIVYYCNSELLIKKFNGLVPLMYCGFYIEVLNERCVCRDSYFFNIKPL